MEGFVNGNASPKARAWLEHVGVCVCKISQGSCSLEVQRVEILPEECWNQVFRQLSAVSEGWLVARLVPAHFVSFPGWNTLSPRVSGEPRH